MVPGPTDAAAEAHFVPSMLNGREAAGLGDSAAVMLFVAPSVSETPESVCDGPSVYPVNAPLLVAKYCETNSVLIVDQSRMLVTGTTAFTLVAPFGRKLGRGNWNKTPESERTETWSPGWAGCNPDIE